MKITNKIFFAHLLFSLIVCYVRNHQNQAMKPMGVLPIVDTETFGSCIALWRINVVMRSFWAAGMTVLKPRTCRMEMARLEDGSIPITEIARRNQQGLLQAGKVARVDEGAEADSMLFTAYIIISIIKMYVIVQFVNFFRQHLLNIYYSCNFKVKFLKIFFKHKFFKRIYIACFFYGTTKRRHFHFCQKTFFFGTGAQVQKRPKCVEIPHLLDIPIHAQGAQVSLDQRAQTSLHLSKALLRIIQPFLFV